MEIVANRQQPSEQVDWCLKRLDPLSVDWNAVIFAAWPPKMKSIEKNKMVNEEIPKVFIYNVF